MFFHIANGYSEWLMLPAVVLLNWRTGQRRRLLTCTAAAIYYLTRVWTYLYFAPNVVDFDQRPPTPGTSCHRGMMADLEQWAALGMIRTSLVAVTYTLLLLAHSPPPRSRRPARPHTNA